MKEKDFTELISLNFFLQIETIIFDEKYTKDEKSIEFYQKRNLTPLKSRSILVLECLGCFTNLMKNISSMDFQCIVLSEKVTIKLDDQNTYFSGLENEIERITKKIVCL